MFKKIIAGLTAITMLAGLSFSNNEIISDFFNTVSVNAYETLENGLRYETVTRVSDGEKSIVIFGVDYKIEDTIESIEIPEEIDGIPVTSINFKAFSDCTSLKEIKIPDSVTNIGEDAFKNTAIVNNQTTDLKYVGNRLVQCDNKEIENVEISKGTKGISDGVFLGCKSLKKVNIPDSVTNIGGAVFKDCTSLTEITISDGVTAINRSAFYCCTSLTEITILNPECEIFDSSATISNGYGSNDKYYFDGTIRGYENSTAQAYAEKYGYKFELIDGNFEPEKNADIDGDGITSSNDGLKILQVITNTAELTDEQKKTADLDGDGELTSADALIILQMIVSLI